MSDLDRELRDDEERLRDLENEEATIANRPHDGFADASRMVRLESEIEALDEQIQREKQRAAREER